MEHHDRSDLMKLHAFIGVLYKLGLADIEPSDILVYMSVDFKDPIKAYEKFYLGE